MIFNVKGKYKIIQENTIICEGENIITQLGEAFFLNRCINNNHAPMQYIVIGNGDTSPLKKDEKLGNELLRRTANTLANRDELAVDLSCSFTASEIIGVSEIGVANDKILISHDVFKEIESNNLVNPIGTVEIKYSFQFSTATIKQGWSKVTTSNNLYRIFEPTNVILVYENTTKNGYAKTSSLENCEKYSSSYYYDNLTQVLFVHTSNGNHPDTLELIVQSR